MIVEVTNILNFLFCDFNLIGFPNTLFKVHDYQKTWIILIDE